MTIHSFVPGRLRLEIAKIAKDETKTNYLNYVLSTTLGIIDTSCNYRTGKLLIHYDQSKISESEIYSKIQTLIQDYNQFSELASKNQFNDHCKTSQSAVDNKNIIKDSLGNLFMDTLTKLIIPNSLQGLNNLLKKNKVFK